MSYFPVASGEKAPQYQMLSSYVGYSDQGLEEKSVRAKMVGCMVLKSAERIKRCGIET